MKIAVIGAGAWGTALAILMAENGHQVLLCAREEALAAEMRARRENAKYLPGCSFPAGMEGTSDLREALEGASFSIMATPSHGFREALERARAAGVPKGMPFISVAKGIELETDRRMSQIIAEIFPDNLPGVLGGPNLAREIAQGMPAACVVASSQEAVAQQVQQALSSQRFRVYTSQDVVGVELGGALKNVVAIAAGICDGLGFGDNSKAALVTRGLAEMKRLAVACGGQRETLSGLSGMGDLMVTCFSSLSRNHALGERIGRGESLESVLKNAVTVAEGVRTARSALHLARSLGVEVPIITGVCRILHENLSPKDALMALMSRDLKKE